jgi:hypothetical protein
MRLSTSVMLVALFLVPACKKKPTEGSQARADADYVVSKLSTVCDGANVAEAKAYGASGPHSIAIVASFAESSSGFYAVVTPKSSVAETELVGCVEHAGTGSDGRDGPSTARVVRARDGVEVARFTVGASNGRMAHHETLAKEFDPYVRGSK